MARTFSRGRPRSAICASTLARMTGSDRANSTMCSYLALSRISRKSG